jgi:hypothetical protein
MSGYRTSPCLASTKPSRRRTQAGPKVNDHADLIEGLKSLGMVAVAATQVEAAVKSLYPSGIDGVSQGEVLRAVFLHLRAQEYDR